METLTKGYDESTEIRESYEILPLQGVWTWLTGKEILDRDHLWRSSSAEMVAWSLVWVVVGVLLTVLAVYYSESTVISVTAYVIGVIFSASGARYVIATIIHHGVANMNVSDLKLTAPATARLLGKGAKVRLVPLLEPTAALLNSYLQEHHGRYPEQKDGPLFCNNVWKRLTRAGISYILQKYAKEVA
ncbi:hypothetical protein ACVCGZ_05900 [Serratia nematodiphila]